MAQFDGDGECGRSCAEIGDATVPGGSGRGFRWSWARDEQPDAVEQGTEAQTEGGAEED